MKKIAGRWLEHPRMTIHGVISADVFTWGYCRVLREQHPPPYGWHLSISCVHRYPTWDEIKAARYDLLPDDVTMAMLLPPRSDYVNLHKNCFHLHQIHDHELNSLSQA
jgi:hypothetical protein